MYVFLDKNREPPVGIDTMAELSSIQDDIPQMNAHQFQERICQTFNDLNDAHTVYIKPVSYRNIAILQMFGLQSFVKNNKQSIYVGDVMHPDLLFMRGWEILEIDGKPAMEVIIDFANTTVSISKDLGTRFNLAVETYWQRRGMSIYNMPTAPSVHYTFKDGNGTIHSNVEFPYLGFVGKSISSTAQLMGQYMNLSLVDSYKRYTLNEERHVLDILKPDVDIDYSKIRNNDWSKLVTPKTAAFLSAVKTEKFMKPTAESREKKQPPIVPQPVTVLYVGKQSGISFYKIGDEVGVLRITTFSPADIVSFYLDAIYSLLIAQDLNLTKLILDLRDNGGGYICLGYSLIGYIWENFKVEGNYDMRRCPAHDNLAVAAAANMSIDSQFNPNYWINSATGERFQNASWLIPGVLHTRGGVRNAYSQLLHDDCQDDYEIWPKPRHYIYSPVSILVLTHGYCGSTCSVFLRNLQEFHRVRTLVVGGIKGMPQSASSFTGGQVSNSRTVLSTYQLYNLSNALNAPQPFWTTSYMTYTFREIYSWTPGHEDEPMEFFLEPSDYKMDYSEANAANDTWLYYDASQFFTKCKTVNDTQPCNVENGYGIHNCIVEQGIYSTECEVTACNPGFFKGDAGACEPCALGTYKTNEGAGPCESCTNAPENAEYVGQVGATSSDECEFACKSSHNFDYSGNRCVKASSAVGIVIALLFGIAIGAGGSVGVLLYLRRNGKIQWSRKRYSHLSSEFNEAEM